MTGRARKPSKCMALKKMSQMSQPTVIGVRRINMTSDELLAEWCTELLKLIQSEGATRTPKVRDFIREKRILDAEFESLAMTLILLKEAMGTKQN